MGQHRRFARGRAREAVEQTNEPLQLRVRRLCRHGGGRGPASKVEVCAGALGVCRHALAHASAGATAHC